MKLRDIKSTLDAEVFCGGEQLDREVDHAFSSDLLSDVLAFVDSRTVLLTGLINTQVIRTAELIDLPAVIFVRNKKPDPEIIRLARQNRIIIMCTKDAMYTASGKLYASGLKGIKIAD